MNKPIVVGMGEALWDVLPDGKKIGGAPANFAFHAGQAGMDSRVVSAVGNDALGEEALATLEGKGLNIEAVARVDFPTGVVNVSLGEQGIPQYDICEGVAWDNIPFTPALANLASQAQAVCWGSLAQRNEVSRKTIFSFLDAMPSDEERLKVFDINLRQQFYTLEIIEASCRRANVLKINDEELVLVSELLRLGAGSPEVLCRSLMERYGLRILVLTCGANGSYVFTPVETSYRVTPKVQVADTVGAGDSFTATLVGELLRNTPVGVAHEHAVEVAAYVCTQQGAMAEWPDSLRM
ncbi:carbohydrate kinase family protein [Prevotellamassilia timonensis]|uniref:carbohydrate kinase family protein n=1 Tax=Prevotellamassilia timonensis TaxID=1852370 RepID=UPI001F28E7F2|nr:carbohydrate kinase [Prevotellamassilia timonensis]MCF2634178.1 carbohydrate kinase [Prevotellamassilia timonensis]